MSTRFRPLEPLGWRWLKGLGLVAAAAYVFSPVFSGGWLWDDDTEITGNPALRSIHGLGDIWSGRAGADYFPLKTTLQWCQWHLWDDRVLGYHLTNVGLHVLGAMLLWRLVASLGIKWAWFAGLLFVVHPLTVESVAWISELKNVLSLPLLLGAMIYYVDWEGRAGRLAPPGTLVGPAGLAAPPYLKRRRSAPTTATSPASSPPASASRISPGAAPRRCSPGSRTCGALGGTGPRSA